LGASSLRVGELERDAHEVSNISEHASPATSREVRACRERRILRQGWAGIPWGAIRHDACRGNCHWRLRTVASKTRGRSGA